MRGFRLQRAVQMVVSGMILLQIGGCAGNQFLELVQTVLLGVTAAGAVTIMRNI